MQKVNILGINFTKISKEDTRKYFSEALDKPGTNLVVTPNAEFVLTAQHDEEFFYILNHADLAILDGSGPQFATWVLLNPIPRYPGADLVIDLLNLANTQRLKTLVINWQDGLTTEQELKLLFATKFPDIILEVVNTDRKGSTLNKDQINNFGPQIILANLGAPHQEKVLYHLKDSISSLKIAVGIGGALDFLTGKIKRAPKLMRLVGIEWLWRLIQRPSKPGEKIVFKRYRRIWNAVFVFVYRFIRWQFFLRFFYRPNVACWLYKPTENGYSVLMVERTDQPGHWQLPQGGTDGDTPEIAGKRELFEELHVTNLQTKAIYKNVWKWSYIKQNRSEVKRHMGYKGQQQSLLIAQFTGNDSEVVINFWDHLSWKWVPTEHILEVANERRIVGYKKYLDLFNQTVKNETKV